MRFFLLFIILSLSACQGSKDGVGETSMWRDYNPSVYWSYGNCNQSYFPDRFLCGYELRKKNNANTNKGNELQNYATNLAIEVVEKKITSDKAHSLLDTFLNDFHLRAESEEGLDPKISYGLLALSFANSQGYSLSDFTDDLSDTAEDLSKLSTYNSNVPSFAISSNSYSGGMSKVCNYSCVGSAYSISVGAAEICPLNPPCDSAASIKKININKGTLVCLGDGEFSKGMNKVCKYDCLGSAHAITISAVEICPISVKR